MSRISDCVTIYGHGEKHLFLLPGFLGNYCAWDKNLDCLSAQFTVYQISYPDYNETTVGYLLSDFVNHAKKIIESFGLKDIILVGHSIGGQVATVLATQLPSVVKIILIGTPDIAAHRSYSERRTFLSPTAENFKKALWSIVYDKSLDVDDFLEKATDDFIGGGRLRFRGLIKTIRHIVNNDISGHLRALDIPILIVWGRNDEIVPVSVAYQMHDKVANSSLVVFDACGHAPPFECPNKFNAVVSEFCLNDL